MLLVLYCLFVVHSSSSRQLAAYSIPGILRMWEEEWISVSRLHRRVSVWASARSSLRKNDSSLVS